MALKTVSVPKEVTPLFEKAEQVVGKYFEVIERDPTKGTIMISGERYILVRAESMCMIEQMTKVLGEEYALNFMYNYAKIIGNSDAKAFHYRMNLRDPIEKLSAGPVHFSHTGWAFVDILPESNPTPDDKYFLIYDHPNTFEADIFVKNNTLMKFPVCVYSAGYSAGWCSESFGLELDAKEVACRAMGSKNCRFIMAPKHLLKSYVEKYQSKH